MAVIVLGIGFVCAPGNVSGQTVRWDFGREQANAPQLVPHGDIQRDLPGPRPPEFPDFGDDNTAIGFGGDGARLMVEDAGAGSVFDFDSGDAITLEAWINVREPANGSHAYVIGKGRTHAPGFSRENHNWALRLTGSEGGVKLSFLFATPPAAGGQPWHRWTSDNGFITGTGWHHIAVTYVFGEPTTIAGWIDGSRTAGSWDMGGATDKAPVVDDDAVWLGSSMGGSRGNSLVGMLDEVAVHRSIVPDSELKARFHREGPQRIEMPELIQPQVADTDIPAGSVLMLVAEGLAWHTRWPHPDQPMQVSTELLHEFYIPRMPFRYDAWGIRESWKPAAMVTMVADVTMPPGEHYGILRVRGLSRLWVDGTLILITRPHSGSTDGHGPVLPLPEPPRPGLEPVAYGDHEYPVVFEIPPSGKARVIVESVIGGKSLRVEPGEMCLAIATDNSYFLLAPSGRGTELTPSGMRRIRQDTETELRAIDERTRHEAAATQNPFWERRHAFARKVAETFAMGDDSSIDGFLEARIARARDEFRASENTDPTIAAHFHQRILPLLDTHCFRCHGESKQKGKLRLDSRDAALDAIVPGEPADSEMIARITADDPDERMPPQSHANSGNGLNAEEVNVLRDWVAAGAPWPAAPLPDELAEEVPALDDAAFLRRVYLDTIGIPPGASDVLAYTAATDPDKSTKLVDQMLADDRFADHWVSYWQDILAENPNILKPSLNNTGPFRFFLHESLRDNKPLDRMVTELILLRGSEHEGGAAGFGMAADNDSPLAAKAHVLGNAFLGIEMQCARCHDSPYHSTTQRDLYSIAAMLHRDKLAAPQSSTVPAGFFERNKGRESLIKVTLPPGEPVAPVWPFAEETGIRDSPELDTLTFTPGDPRDRLAALITAPQNQRFARVLVNRLWRRLIG
ncbi:MAG: DUF1549 domain-containing protein, partial [Verrucomicrobiae bacterium]|nr:DUF1549 domain-containing protein [Verrucomicrobiae bacterium]